MTLKILQCNAGQSIEMLCRAALLLRELKAFVVSIRRIASVAGSFRFGGLFKTVALSILTNDWVSSVSSKVLVRGWSG